MRWPDEPGGSGRPEAWLKKFLRACIYNAPVDSPDIRVVHGTHGTYLELTQKAGGGATLRQLRLKAHGDDWLRCRTWDGTQEGTDDIYVARDPELRRTRFDGKTIAYSSDGDAFSASFVYESPTKRVKTVSTAETQVIVPYYVIDAATGSTSTSTIISCIRSSDPTGVDDPNGNEITLVEVTQRAWAKLDTSGGVN